MNIHEVAGHLPVTLGDFEHTSGGWDFWTSRKL